MTETIIYHCHFWNEHIRDAWNKLVKESGRNCYVLFDASNSPPPDVAQVLTVTMDEAKSSGFTVTPPGFWSNTEIALILVKHRIEGDYFWHIDHDVRCTGNWKEFFDNCPAQPHDLLPPGSYDLVAPGFGYYNPTDGWPWWDVGNCSVALTSRMRAFMCLYRISRRALEALELRYRAGQTGFIEMLVPTLLSDNRLPIAELNSDWLDPATFRPGPVRNITTTVNCIEHPIREGRTKLEVDSCRSVLSKWCTGTGLDLGFGGSVIVPTAITIDRPEGQLGRPVLLNAHPTNIVGEADGLGWFTDNSLEYVFSSHLLEDFEDTGAVLREWLRVIKPGGHLVLFLPDQKTYVDYCAKNHSLPNGAHKHDDFSLAYVKEKLPQNCEVVYEQFPFPGNPYSFALVVRKK